MERAGDFFHRRFWDPKHVQLVTAQKNTSTPHMVLLSPRSYCSLHNRPSNRELDEVLGQEEQPYWESRRTEEMVDYCPKEPSCPSLDASLLKLLILYCNTAYGHCCDRFRYTCIHSPPNSLPTQTAANTEQSSMCCTESPCLLSTLNTVYTCPSQIPYLFPSFSPPGNHVSFLYRKKSGEARSSHIKRCKK